MNSRNLLKLGLNPICKRFVSDIKLEPSSVVYKGKTYTKMIYPFTFSARIFNFPWYHYWKHSIHFKILIIVVVAFSPLWFKVDRLVNSPTNKKIWEDKRAAEHAKHHKKPWEV